MPPAGLYDLGRALYEKGGFPFDELGNEGQLKVEKDYQICVRRSWETRFLATPKEKNRMSLELNEISLPVPAEVKIEFSLTAQVNVTDFTAQRKVSKLLLDHVGNLLYGERPSLMAGRRLLWRVPVWLALPTTGPLEQVGTLDVDAQTGEILFTQQILDEIAERGNALAQRATPTTD